MRKRAELLAPAGDFEICKAVINAGADAVYLGGAMYGARAYAGNLSGEEIIEAIDYAHLRGAKIYLTVNTLLKEKEMSGLGGYLKPLYEAGLDAVIVQDYGVMERVMELFPGLSVHASTQMAVMNEEFIYHLKSTGVKRVVLPREMTLEEIRLISQNTGMELEVFVHGALCYSYSGQCLFSSAKGGRSGNRGTCAQPCRLEYSTGKGMKRILSPKDIAAVRLLPDIIDAGAFSLKIEGRMKNVFYAAGVTSVYRKYLDLFLAGEKSSVSEDDMRDLMDLYNRGSFSEGLFCADKGPGLMSADRAKHRGTKALRVEKNTAGHVTFTALEDIHGGDVIEADEDFSFTCGGEVSAGGRFEMDLPKRLPLTAKRVLYRMNNGELQRRINESFVKKQKKAAVDMEIVLKKGSEAHLRMIHKPSGIEAGVFGEPVQAAIERPFEPSEIIAKLKKLGDSPFEAASVDVISDPDIFISVGGLNALRRSAAAVLEEKVTNFYKREPVIFDNNEKNDIISGCLSDFKGYTALIFSNEQLERVIRDDRIVSVYVSFHLAGDGLDAMRTAERIKESGKEAFLALPYFYRQRHIKIFRGFLDNVGISSWDGVLVRNISQIRTLSQMKGTEKTRVRTDHMIPAYNREAAGFISRYASRSGFELDCMTLSPELSSDEMKVLFDGIPRELVCYGKTVLMQSEHCVKKSLGICDRHTGVTYISGYAVYSFCDYCNNIILDEKPLNLMRKTGEGKAFIPDRLRLDLTTESAYETDAVLFSLGESGEGIPEYTGRFTSGVV